MQMCSGSGLDPHITPAGAVLQVDRVSLARHLTAPQKEKLLSLINTHIETPDFGVLGEARVNILALNLALDRLE